MLNKGWKYKAKFIKFPQDRFTVFQVSSKDKRSGAFKNYNIFCQGKLDIKDDDEIEIIEITGVDQSENFSQKHNKTFLNLTVYCEVEVVGMAEGTPEPIIEITADELPW